MPNGSAPTNPARSAGRPGILRPVSNRSDRSAPRRPTLGEVASLAGVGLGTASRALNGSPQVSDRAREAVFAAVAQLGYVRNRAARSLVTGRTDSVVLVVSESEARFFSEPFFAGVVRGVSSALAASPRQLLLAMAQSVDERERLETYLTTQHVDGVMLMSLHGDDPLPERLERRGLPTVLGGRPLKGDPVSFVDVDNVGGAASAVAHLVTRGRSRIVTVTGPLDMTAGWSRLEGFRRGLERAGLPYDPAFAETGDFTGPSGAAAMAALLKRVPDLDAVFAASDLMAEGAMRHLKQLGRRIPEDVAVVGFDDSPLATHSDPPLTTVHQPVEGMGRAMAELLMARIDGQEHDLQVVLETHLVARAST
jgi:DNA-binding LacI/PurR family transcriptional regulator